jgi:sterol 24-C-methyltransferase
MGKCATVSGVAVVVVAAVIGQWASRNVDPWYRAVTSARALKAVLSLSRAEINDFTASYELFEHDVVNNPALEDKIRSYYRVVNHLCALGEVEKMYIPPVYDLKAGVYGNQLLFEKDMAATMDAGTGERLLELGCGRGRIAHHMARLTGAKVTGLNIGEDQVASAREYASATGMDGQLDFVLGSYNDPLPFPNNTFDGFYHVQALTYARDLDALFAELARVLKPGAKVSFLDWFQLDAYDARNKTHASLLRKTKAIIGAVYTPTAQEYIAALRRAGFEIEFSKEASKV